MIKKCFPGTANKISEKNTCFFWRGERQNAPGHGLDHIRESPAAHHPIKGKDEKSCKHPHITDAGINRIRFEWIKCPHRIEMGLSTQGKFCQHDGSANNKNADEINEYEGPSPVFTYDIRKLPDITESDCGTWRSQNEPQPASPEPTLIIAFGLHTNRSIFLR